MYTIDANVLVYYSHGEPRAVDFIHRALSRDDVLIIPTTVIVEFLSYPTLRNEDQSFLEDMLNRSFAMDLTKEIAIRAVDIRRTHRLGFGDSVVAASALLTESSLVTRNVKNFKKVRGLKIVPL